MERQQIIDILLREQCSCVICNSEGEYSKFYGRGVSDLYRILSDEPKLLEDAFVADKVVGKGAAALMILGGVKELYAELLSTAAREMLEEYGVAVTAPTEVPNIINRTGTGICPVESLCLGCRTPEECLPKIRDFIKNMTTK